MNMQMNPNMTIFFLAEAASLLLYVLKKIKKNHGLRNDAVPV